LTAVRADPAAAPALRVLLTIHYPLDYNSGAAGCTLRLAEALEGLGHVVSVFGVDQMVARTHSKVDELWFPFQASAVAARRLVSGSVDVVDASTGDLWPIPRRLVARAHGVVVTRSHGLEQLESAAFRDAARRGEVVMRRRYTLYYGGLRLKLEQRSIRNADAAFVLNQDEQGLVVGELGVPVERCRRVRNGLPGAMLGLPLNDSRNPTGIAVLGPYAWRKGASTSAAVLSQILAEQPDLKASWLGARPESVREALSEGVRDRVEVRASYRLDDLPSLLEGHQILLVLSWSEGMPGVVLEGMACGLAVVASNVPGCRDILAERKTGVLVPPGDVAAAVAAVKHLLSNPDELDRIRHRGHAEAQKYSWRVVASECEAVYRELLRAKQQVP
jgi:glycosyltransferase involved in cell wall biosynthesis